MAFMMVIKGLYRGMCTDGVNPFSTEKVNYSMWPNVLFPPNFPAHVRKLSSSMMLVGIIPGPKEMLNVIGSEKRYHIALTTDFLFIVPG